MELANLLRTVVLYLSNVQPDNLFINESNTFTGSELNASHSLVNSVSTKAINENPLTKDAKNCAEDNSDNSQSTAFMPYDFDCSMPYPPQVITDSTPTSADDNSKSQHQNNNNEHNAKATFTIPLHIVHRLNDSSVIDLKR